jgi:hypothetical protein
MVRKITETKHYKYTKIRRKKKRGKRTKKEVGTERPGH